MIALQKTRMLFLAGILCSTTFAMHNYKKNTSDVEITKKISPTNSLQLLQIVHDNVKIDERSLSNNTISSPQNKNIELDSNDYSTLLFRKQNIKNKRVAWLLETPNVSQWFKDENSRKKAKQKKIKTNYEKHGHPIPKIEQPLIILKHYFCSLIDEKLRLLAFVKTKNFVFDQESCLRDTYEIPVRLYIKNNDSLMHTDGIAQYGCVYDSVQRTKKLHEREYKLHHRYIKTRYIIDPAECQNTDTKKYMEITPTEDQLKFLRKTLETAAKSFIETKPFGIRLYDKANDIIIDLFNYFSEEEIAPNNKRMVKTIKNKENFR